MEPDHYIKSLEVRLDSDPVPFKGRFVFTPQNGRAQLAFQMRSGVGGILAVIGECSRHGRFSGTAEVRVTKGGCTTAPEKAARERVGSPMLRVPRIAKPGEVVEVRAKVDHASHTGLAFRGGKFVRVEPEFFVKEMRVELDGRLVSEFQMTSGVSPNPLIRFPLKVLGPGSLRVVFVNNQGQRWEVAQEIRVSG
jgi:hypothetical protein